MKNNLFCSLLFTLIIGSLLVSCKPDSEKATVVTFPITEITETSAKTGGNVVSDGGAEVTSRGVCWGINQNPTIEEDIYHSTNITYFDHAFC